MSASRPPAIQTGVSAAALWCPRQGNTDTATWCVLGSSARLGEAPQASPLRRLSAFSHRAISFHENSARDRGMSRGPRTVVSFGCAFGGRSASGPERAMRPPRRGATVPAAPAPRASITPPGRLVPARGARRRKRPPAAPRRRHVNCRAGDAVAGRTARPGRTLCAALRRPPFLSPCRLFLLSGALPPKPFSVRAVQLSPWPGTQTLQSAQFFFFFF